MKLEVGYNTHASTNQTTIQEELSKLSYNNSDVRTTKGTRENEVLAHRFHMDIFQNRKLSVADEILATEFVWRNPQIPRVVTWSRQCKENCFCCN